MGRLGLAPGDLPDAAMKTKRAWLLAVALLLAAGGAARATEHPAGGRSVAVDPTACRAVPDRLAAAAAKIVGSDWSHYRPYLCLYPVRAPAGVAPLFLLALDVARADRAHALAYVHGVPVGADDVGGDTDPIPLPAVIDADGRLLGSLPLAFPNDPPATMAVRFSDWRGNFPHRIALRVDDPTQDTAAAPPYCPPPLIWNQAAGRYIEQPGSFHVGCPRR